MSTTTSAAGARNAAEQQPAVEEEESSVNSPRRCAACKYLRRRCADDCVLAPYFPASQPRRYACVHRVFGASNVARLLQSLPVEERGRAAETMATEAQRRVQDPVYGCTGMINRLQEEIRAVQCELARTRAQLALVDVVHGGGARHQAAPAAAAPPPPPPPPPPQQQQTAGGRPDGDVDVQMHARFDPGEFLDLDGF